MLNNQRVNNPVPFKWAEKYHNLRIPEVPKSEVPTKSH